MNISDLAQHQLPPHWLASLKEEFSKSYWLELKNFVLQRSVFTSAIYPPEEQLFAAFENTDLPDVRVVIVGQDPYHSLGQANGLCFSVAGKQAIPPSLRNIFAELHNDLGISPHSHGCLKAWARQGVFLLNTVLTVEDKDPGSHAKRGWESFTDKAIETISNECRAVVFMLWGGYAEKKSLLIDESKHLVLRASHPSPLSAYRGFLGCQHFSLANDFLHANEYPPINWQLEPNTNSSP
ncbi:MAG: uracil-DNA glycosylase [Porticoccaceae bacterium]|nr:uracil-DNA glycosylase [Porticoccaceae bacterium]